MSIKKAVMRIQVKVNGDLLLECGFKLSLQMVHEPGDPSVVPVIILAVADKDIIPVSRYK